MKNNSTTRIIIRQAIFNMDKPFCISDLFSRLKARGIVDRNLIIQVLDEMFEEGLIQFNRVDGIVEGGQSGWAFTIVGA